MMRRKRESVLSFASHDDRLAKTVRQYREKFKGICVALDLVSEALVPVHLELFQLTQGNLHRGRDAVFTSETILRALVVHPAWRNVSTRSCDPILIAAKGN
jgi:hypothetical protein